MASDSSSDSEEVFFDAVDFDTTLGWELAGSLYPLHRAAFENDVRQLAVLLKNAAEGDLATHDPHGNNPLHVAALRGNTEAVQVLLDAGVSPKLRSSRGWTPLDEALAARAMATARLLQRCVLADSKAEMKEKRARLLESMREMPDYSLQLKWSIGSSLPGVGMLVRRYAPHDTYTVWKVGDKLRIDGSLIGIDTSSMIPEWKRGHFSLIVDGSPEGQRAAAEAAAATIAEASAAAEARARALARGGAIAEGEEGEEGEGADEQELDRARRQAERAAAAAVAAGGGTGPRMLFLNHAKRSFVDLSADKKALKLEGKGEDAELEDELSAAMEGEVDRLRLKPRDFRFVPLRGWLGGSVSERAEGWRCSVYEATGRLLAVSTSKTRLVLPQGATFADYLSAHYEADSVIETAVDPLSPSGVGTLNGGGGARGGGLGRVSTGSNVSELSVRTDRNEHIYSLPPGGDSMQLGSEASYDGLVWGEAAGVGAGAGHLGGKARGSASGSVCSRASGASAATTASGGSSGGRLLRAKCWMARDFPMSLAHLLPLLDVMGTANKHLAKVGQFLAQYSEQDMFPVKLQVPLLMTLYVTVGVKSFCRLVRGCATSPTPPADFFDIPSGYRRRLLADVMEKASARMGGAGPSPSGAAAGGGGFYGGDAGEDLLFGDLRAGGGAGSASGRSSSSSRGSSRSPPRRPPRSPTGGRGGSGVDRDAFALRHQLGSRSPL